MKIFLLFAFVAALLSACCKADCLSKEVFVDLKAFRATETDTVWLIRYKPGSFSEPLDTTRNLYPVTATDTSASRVTEYIYGDNSWKIIMPSISLEFAFSNFSFVKRKCCDSRVEVVKEFDMNGRRYSGNNILLPK